MEAVEAAMHKSLQSLKADMASHSKRLQEAETRISAIEDDMEVLQATCNSFDHDIKALLDIVEDQKHHSSRSNFPITGIPETYNANDLQRFCSVAIPEALGLYSPCVVVRAHCIGPLHQNRKGRYHLSLSI